MNLLFLGSSDFSLPFLETLLASDHKVVAVVTTPTKPKGRGLKIQPNPVEILAREKGLLLLAPAKLKDPEALESVQGIGVDVLVVASYGKILPSSWLRLPKKLPINVHPSLLPRYRGAAPINWQIVNGEERTGVSVFKMEEGLDSGDILAQVEMPLEMTDTAATLAEKMGHEGSRLLLKVLREVEEGSVAFAPQDPSQATYARKLTKEDGLVDWGKSAVEIHNLIRGMIPWPGAYTHFQGERLGILSARLEGPGCAEGKPGQVLDVHKEGYLRVHTGEGAVLLDRVQPPGKREMTGHEYAIGRRLGPGMTLS